MVDDLWYYKLKERKKKSYPTSLHSIRTEILFAIFHKKCPKNPQNSTVCKIALLTFGFYVLRGHLVKVPALAQ